MRIELMTFALQRRRSNHLSYCGMCKDTLNLTEIFFFHRIINATSEDFDCQEVDV